MPTRFALLTALTVALQLAPAPAAQQLAPTFDELIAEAGTILVSEVLETRSRWQQLAGRQVIVTDVRLRVEQLLKGRVDAVTTVTLLGGTVGDVTQHVAGMPRFLVGDADVLFLAARPTITSPIVGMSHGRFRVVTGHGGAGRFIANSGRQPVRSLADYAQPSRLAAGERALALDEFTATIAARVRR